jgi:hypothetical protein
MIKRMLVAPAFLPGAQKATVWIGVVLFLSIGAFTAESVGVPRVVALGIAAVLIAPLAWAGALLFTAAWRQPKPSAIKVARV